MRLAADTTGILRIAGGSPTGDEMASMRRLQQKIESINKAGGELVRLGDDLTKLDVGERLKLLDQKIVHFTRDVLNFDHFAIRILDRKSNKLEIVVSAGLPEKALQLELRAEREGNGISGFVASTGLPYICIDTQADKLYEKGLDNARSSLTVPLRLHDRIIGIFNIESDQPGAFDEDDQQFAEIFSNYVAIALYMLDLLNSERQQTHRKVTGDVCAELSGPLNDVQTQTQALLVECAGNDELCKRLNAIMENVQFVRTTLRDTSSGPQRIMGVRDHKVTNAEQIKGARILVADDEENIRTTIRDVLKKYEADVTICENGSAAIAQLEVEKFDLVLSDIRMPDRTGYDVFAAARQSCGNDVKVILMTGFGYDPHHSIMRASQEGMSAVLFKPFLVEKLMDEVRKALSNRTPA